MSTAYKHRRKRFQRILKRLKVLSIAELRFLLIDEDDPNVAEGARRLLQRVHRVSP
jgi:hypothetical protein